MSLPLSLGNKTQLPKDFAHNKRPSLAFCKKQENFQFWCKFFIFLLAFINIYLISQSI
jgi:hypothetical protein